jgi:hypothetical protein
MALGEKRKKKAQLAFINRQIKKLELELDHWESSDSYARASGREIITGTLEDHINRELARLRYERAKLHSELEPASPMPHRRRRSPSCATRKTAVPPAQSDFRPSQDYRSVTLQGQTYALTSRQADVVEILHDSYEEGMPDVPIDRILEKLGTPNARWQDTFKSNPEARKALIRKGGARGPCV